MEMITTRILKAMSEEQLRAFWEAVQADAGLQEKLNAAKDAEAFVAIAKAAGFVISADDLAKTQAELSDEELGGVAGGSTIEVKGNLTISGDLKTWAKRLEGEHGPNATIVISGDHTI